MMSFSNCVEAIITGIHVADDAKTISITMRRKIGPPFSLKAEGVDRFVANEFRERNIVDRVNVWNEKNRPEEFRELLSDLLTGKRQEVVDPGFEPLINMESGAIARGEKVLVEIEPVYGASVVILAQRVFLEPEGKMEGKMQNGVTLTP